MRGARESEETAPANDAAAWTLDGPGVQRGSPGRKPTVVTLPRLYGVGPTQAKTYYEDDLVVCLLRGGFTRVEQTLLEGGRTSAVTEQRMAFQEVMRPRFVEVIEHATGKQVVGFMSGNQQEPDMICEVFVLAPTDLLDE